jgi:hypothetical protein
MTYLCELLFLLLFVLYFLTVIGGIPPSHHSEWQDYDENLVFGSGSHHGSESPPASGSPYGFDAGYEPG